MRAGRMTMLDWLDVCANELEVDGVIVDIADCVRTDDDYLAQHKKAAADLGLTVAALEIRAPVDDAFDGDAALAAAVALGAPIAMIRAPLADGDATAWGSFTDTLKSLCRAAKRANVTLGLRDVAGTLCAASADLPRVAKDVDSSWLRFAVDIGAGDIAPQILAKTVIATCVIAHLDDFAREGDTRARDAIHRLRRFRGFVSLERDDDAAASAPAAYHAAVERFTIRRTDALATSALVTGES
jgi:sugar phosphate isomerase/epimerase